jgi:hypothetical protein
MDNTGTTVDSTRKPLGHCRVFDNQRVLVRFVSAPAKTMAASDWLSSVIEGLCQRDWSVLDKNLVTSVAGLFSALA